ncbi:hypothetical protein D3C74_411080 [compost metagenome]
MGLVGAIRGGDEEDQVGLAVLGTEVHLRVQAGHGQGGHGHRCRTAMRNGNAAGNAGGGLGFAGLAVGGQGAGIGGTALFGNQ